MIHNNKTYFFSLKHNIALLWISRALRCINNIYITMYLNLDCLSYYHFSSVDLATWGNTILKL